MPVLETSCEVWCRLLIFAACALPFRLRNHIGSPRQRSGDGDGCCSCTGAANDGGPRPRFACRWSSSRQLPRGREARCQDGLLKPGAGFEAAISLRLPIAPAGVFHPSQSGLQRSDGSDPQNQPSALTTAVRRMKTFGSEIFPPGGSASNFLSSLPMIGIINADNEIERKISDRKKGSVVCTCGEIGTANQQHPVAQTMPPIQGFCSAEPAVPQQRPLARGRASSSFPRQSKAPQLRGTASSLSSELFQTHLQLQPKETALGRAHDKAAEPQTWQPINARMQIPCPTQTLAAHVSGLRQPWFTQSSTIYFSIRTRVSWVLD